MKKHGVPRNHITRQVPREDFVRFDYILCMVENILRDLARKSNQVKNRKAKMNYLGTVVHKTRLLLKAPIRRMSPTLRPYTRHV